MSEQDFLLNQKLQNMIDQQQVVVAELGDRLKVEKKRLRRLQGARDVRQSNASND